MDETKKRDQTSVIIFYTLVLRSFFFFTLTPCAVSVREFWGNGANASPTGAVGLFGCLLIEDWVTVLIYSSMFHQLLRKD
jgi:hypothetical protein